MSSRRPWSSEDKPGELATSFGSGRGRQKVIRGTGTVTPREPLMQTENGHTEELIPGRHRFHPKLLAGGGAGGWIVNFSENEYRALAHFPPRF